MVGLLAGAQAGQVEGLLDDDEAQTAAGVEACAKAGIRSDDEGGLRKTVLALARTVDLRPYL